MHYHKIKNIQIMRGIAALLVLVFHTLEDLNIRGYHLFYKESFGEIGVALFFILSGYIMLYSIDKHNYSSSPSTFIIRRFIRIIPLYWILTTLVIIALFKFPHLFKSSHELSENTILSSLFFFNHDPLLRVGWTLNYEMLFYLILFLSLVISRRYFVISCLILLVLLLAHYIFGLNILGQDEYIINFLIGGIFYKILHYYKLFSFKINFWISLLLIIISVMIADNNLILISLISAVLFIIVLFQSDKNFLGSNKLRSCLTYLGNISYSLYLSHFFFLNLSNKLLVKLHTPSYLAALVTIIFSIIGASIVFKFCENWLNRNLNNFLIRRNL